MLTRQNTNLKTKNAFQFVKTTGVIVVQISIIALDVKKNLDSMTIKTAKIVKIQIVLTVMTLEVETFAEAVRIL